MKKNQLLTIALIGIAVACNAMSLTEKIILSKSTETTPVALGSENPDETLTITDITSATNNNQIEYGQVKGVERLTIKALKNISRFLVKEVCRVSKPNYSKLQNISYARRNFYNARIMSRPSLTALVQ